MARVVILGASGSGKSWFAGYLLELAAPQFDFVIHFDIENEEVGLSDSARDPLLKTLYVDEDRYSSLNLPRVVYRNRRVRVVPEGLTLEEMRELYGRLCRTAMILAAEENAGSVYVSCDEAHNVVPQQNNLDDRVERLITGGRKYGAEVQHTSQRPQLLHKTALSQVDRAVYFRLGEDNDIRKIQKQSEIDANLLLELDKRQCIIENRDSGERVTQNTEELTRTYPHYSGDDGIVDEVLPV
jgi:DNA helicase HerA-like ATPase